MTAYNDIVKSRHKTLTAGQVDTLTFSTNYSKVAVTMRVPATGSAGLWVGVNGTDPSAAANDTDWVAPAAGAEIIIDLESGDIVEVFSATADAYSVRGVN